MLNESLFFAKMYSFCKYVATPEIGTKIIPLKNCSDVVQEIGLSMLSRGFDEYLHIHGFIV